MYLTMLKIETSLGGMDRFYMFDVDDDVVDYEEAIREAVNEYFATEEGKDFVRYDREPDWEDAMELVPDEIWANHGLCRRDFEEFVVSSSETLATKEEWNE